MIHKTQMRHLQAHTHTVSCPLLLAHLIDKEISNGKDIRITRSLDSDYQLHQQHKSCIH